MPFTTSTKFPHHSLQPKDVGENDSSDSEEELNSQPSVYVYAAVDISSSMRGPKITQVCESFQEIISNCPDQVLFDITLFDQHASQIMTSKKCDINCEQLIRHIEDVCARGYGTALYDAWGDMISNIPITVLKSKQVQIFVLTDGEDTASKLYTVPTLLGLTKTIVDQGEHVKFNFIQCGDPGPIGTVFLNTLEETCGTQWKNLETQVVPDNAQGIQKALKSVQRDIMLSTTKKKGGTLISTDIEITAPHTPIPKPRPRKQAMSPIKEAPPKYLSSFIPQANNLTPTSETTSTPKFSSTSSFKLQ